LIARLERVLTGDCSRLLIAMPPGSGKSVYASVLFPVYALANLPDAQIIAASHTAELSEKWGRRTRNLVAEHGEVLGISLRPDSQASARWELESGGSYAAIGAGGAIVGLRADLLILDDVVRSREDAFSEPSRRALFEWYQTEVRTRLKPGGRIVAIGTRWHHDDILGKLLEESESGAGERWETLVLPAVAGENDPIGRKPGEWLWSDDDYGFAASLQREQKIQSPYNWAALYQQTPSPETGRYFEADWIKPWSAPPDLKSMRVYAGSDFAVTSKGGDFTVHAVVGIDNHSHLYLLDLWRAQAAPDVWCEQLLTMAKRWQPICWAFEKGQILSSVGPFLTRRQTERRIPLYRREFATKTDKETRAQSIRAMMSMHGLRVDTRASWHATFIDEILKFPAGKYDDVVDALSLVGMMLDVVMPGLPPKKDEKVALPRDYVEIEDDRMLERAVRDPEFTLHEIVDDDYGGSNLKLL
jgi:predicted phage terminase large subunit-like protein